MSSIVKSSHIAKVMVPGLISAVGGAIGSLTTSFGGQVSKGGKS